MSEHRFDVVGDVHGQLGALLELGRHLGYDVNRGWAHGDGRVLVFLGDLVDRGEDSLGVAELVMNLVAEGRAVCLMGNHEYNLVRYDLGLTRPKHSNRATIADMKAHPSRWAPVIEFFAALPLAIELPEVRIIHAVWHRGSYDRVEPILRPRTLAPAGSSTACWLAQHVVLGSPFSGRGLVTGLPGEPQVPPGNDAAHEVLIKGYEAVADEPFPDSDGKVQENVRVTWWDGPRPGVIPEDKVAVFGHYWNLPPLGSEGPFAPPHPSGHPELKAWQRRVVDRVPEKGFVDVPRSVKAVCVDYNGVFDAKAGSCVGAYRWPEQQVAWARVPAAAAPTAG